MKTNKLEEKKPPVKIITPEIQEMIEKLSGLGIVNQTLVRNLNIIYDFEVKRFNGTKYEDAIYELSAFYNTSTNTIISVTNKKKRPQILNGQ